MKRRLPLILVVIALLGAAFWLSRCSDKAIDRANGRDPDKVTKKVVYPRDAPASDDADLRNARPTAAATKRDPLLSALSDKGAVVLELNAIRHSPLAEKVLACRAQAANDGLSKLKNALGIDPLEDLDRVGLDNNVVVVTGHFENLKIPKDLGAAQPYGTAARIYTLADSGDDAPTGTDPADKDRKPLYVAQVGDGLMVTAASEDELHAAIDRVEGRAEAGTPLPSSLMNAEAYGAIGPELLQSLLAGAHDPLATRMQEVLTGGQLRMNVDDAVGLSVDLTAKSDDDTRDLGKSVSGALAALRSKAALEGDTELAGLLEQARVDTDHGKLQIDVAVPGALVLKAMGCDENGKPLPGSKARAYATPPSPPTPVPTTSPPPSTTP